MIEEEPLQQEEVEAAGLEASGSVTSRSGGVGRIIALTGVVFAIGIALLSMTLLALNLLPEIFPTLAPELMD